MSMHYTRSVSVRSPTCTRMQAVTEERGFSLRSSLNDDLVQIMMDNAEAVCTAHPPGTFGRFFGGNTDAGCFCKGR